MKAYSEDLRQKIVAVVRRGMPKTQAACLFGVSLSSVKRYARVAHEGSSLAPKKRPGRPRKLDGNAKKLLEVDMEERPAATIAERRRLLECITGTRLSHSTVWRLLKTLASAEKKGFGCNREGQMAQGGLASDDRQQDRRKAAGVRR